MFYVFSFPAGVYAGTLNLIAPIPDPSIIVNLVYPRFWSRNFFLIAPFPDRFLLVPFNCSMFNVLYTFVYLITIEHN